MGLRHDRHGLYRFPSLRGNRGKVLVGWTIRQGIILLARKKLGTLESRRVDQLFPRAHVSLYFAHTDDYKRRDRGFRDCHRLEGNLLKPDRYGRNTSRRERNRSKRIRWPPLPIE